MRSTPHMSIRRIFLYYGVVDLAGWQCVHFGVSRSGLQGVKDSKRRDYTAQSIVIYIDDLGLIPSSRLN